MRKRERIDRTGREGRGRISSRGGARQNQRVREQLWGGTLGVEEGDNNDSRRSERVQLSYQEGDGIRGTRRDTALRSLR